MSENLGLGLISHILMRNNGESVLQGNLKKRIIDLSLSPEGTALLFTFEDGKKMSLADEGQSCCEMRYMSTDDDLRYYIDGNFLGVEVKGGPTEEDRYGTHEVQFLEVKTDIGSFTMANHNQHNGYYGGFALSAREIP